MKLIARCSLTALVLGLVAGCGGNPDSPLEVAEKFWGALEDQNLDKAKSFASAGTAESLQLNNNGGGDVDIKFGAVNFEHGMAMIETSMQSSMGGSDMTVPMKTVLVQERGEWRVDVNHTMMSAFGGAMGGVMDEMGEAMQESMEELGKAMEAEMKKAMQEMEASMSKQDH